MSSKDKARGSPGPSVETIAAALEHIITTFLPERPKAITLFGSAVPYLDGDSDAHPPNDLDLVVVGDLLMASPDTAVSPIPVEFHPFRSEEIISIAHTLRYSPKPLALSRLYGKAVVRQHSRNIIAACLLLGPSYRNFGIEQIDVNGLEDPRDYSRHRVLHGHDWWRRLQAFARHRRNPIEHMADKIVGADRFR